MFTTSESFGYDELDRLTDQQKYDDKGRITENNLGIYNYTNTAKTYQNTSIDLRKSAVTSYENKQCIFYDDMEIGDGFIAEQPTAANYYLPIRYSNSITPKSGGKSIRILKKETSLNAIQSGKWLAINNTKDTEYTYSGWIYCYSSNAAQIQLLMKTANETANFTLTDKIINPSASNLMSGDGWVYLEKKILIPANIKQLSIRLENIGSLDSSVWFDDVCIRKTENITPLRELNITYNAFKSPVQIEETGVDKISFLYNDANNRSSMFYGGLQDDKLLRPLRKHYSIDGSAEIKYNTQTNEVEFITYIGGDGYTAPVVLKSNGTTQDYLYLHRDYQGTILAISNALGAVVEKRLFDAWGQLLKVEDGKGNVLSKMMILDRGYTGHEHLQSVGLIHMNGRLYDAKLHRFLQPDNFVQDPYNTQNFNRYGYVLNNPLKYIDPTGESWNSWWSNNWRTVVTVVAAVATAVVIVASMGTATPIVAAMWAGAGAGLVGGALGAALNGGNIGDIVMAGGMGCIFGAITGVAGAYVAGFAPAGAFWGALYGGTTNIAIGAITNTMQGRPTFEGAALSGTLGAVGGAAAGFQAAKAQGLNPWTGATIKPKVATITAGPISEIQTGGTPQNSNTPLQQNAAPSEQTIRIVKGTDGTTSLSEPIPYVDEAGTNYTYTKTAAKHMDELVRKGENAGQNVRPYMKSPLTIEEIMSTGKGIPDATFPGGMNWKIPGNFRGSDGIWELGINPKTKTIYHFNFTN